MSLSSFMAYSAAVIMLGWSLTSFSMWLMKYHKDWSAARRRISQLAIDLILPAASTALAIVMLAYHPILLVKWMGRIMIFSILIQLYYTSQWLGGKGAKPDGSGSSDAGHGSPDL